MEISRFPRPSHMHGPPHYPQPLPDGALATTDDVDALKMH